MVEEERDIMDIGLNIWEIGIRLKRVNIIINLRLNITLMYSFILKLEFILILWVYKSCYQKDITQLWKCKIVSILE